MHNRLMDRHKQWTTKGVACNVLGEAAASQKELRLNFIVGKFASSSHHQVIETTPTIPLTKSDQPNEY